MSNTKVDNEIIYIDDNENSQEEKATDKSTDSTVTKNILLYKNGDLFFPAKRFVVNKKYIRNWECFLEELTKNLNPRNGAIRDIRTPFHGTRIRSLDDLTANGKYVAISKGETLKIIDYEKVVNINSPPQPRKANSLRLKPLRFANNDVEKTESRITQHLYVKSNIIYVFRNGDPFTRAIKVVIKPQEQKHMSILVKAIEDRVLLQTNKPIRRLYTMEGELVRFAKDIENGQYYVAASHESFENIKYGQFLPVIRGGRVASRRNQIRYLNQNLTPREGDRSQRNDTEVPTNRSQKSQEPPNNKPKSTTNQQQKNNPKQKKEKEIAVTKIQAAFRGYYTRKEIAKAKENNEPIPQTKFAYIPKKQKVKNTEKSENETNKIQNKNNRVKKEEKEVVEKSKSNEIRPQKKMEPKSSRKEEKKSNEKIDNTEKNKVNEKKANPNKENSKDSGIDDQEKAAIKIQAGFRGFKTRQNLKTQPPKDSKKPPVQVKEKPPARVKEKSPAQTKEKKTQPKAESKRENQPKTDEKKKDENNDVSLEKAAITIQAGFRGYKTRHDLKQKDNSAKIIQAAYRGNKARDPKENAQKPNETDKTESDDADQTLAATRIQAGFRGYKARKDFQEKENAIKRIQAGFRGYKARKDFQEKENAIKRIQAGFRGYKTRKSLKEKENAAKVIQAGYRGFDRRRTGTEKENAATRIQAGYRGYKVRKELASQKPKSLTPEEQAQERNKAATKIQAAFRGHIYRRDKS